jgi:hypothetical protein
MKLYLASNQLTIELEWYEQFWAVILERYLHIPLANINRVSTTEPQTSWMQVRAPGTFIPGVIKAGTYYSQGSREFWYVTSDKNYLTLELQNESYRQIVVTIPDNIDWGERINRALDTPQHI